MLECHAMLKTVVIINRFLIDFAHGSLTTTHLDLFNV